MAIISWYDTLTGDAWRRWLEALGAESQVSYRYIDPFDTSRRDLKEVPSLLQGVVDTASLPERGPAGNQNVIDMKRARLCDGPHRTAMQLTPLGSSVLDAWQRAGITAAVEVQELGRYIVVVLCARNVAIQDHEAFVFYAAMESFWAEMRSIYSLDQLLEGKGLHLIPYLAFEREGFIPWATVRANSAPLPRNWYDVNDFLQAIGQTTQTTREGASKLLKRMQDIGGRINDRQTWCAALEVCSRLDSNPTKAIRLLESWK